MNHTFAARVLNPGTAEGEILVLEETLSFWGGFDPAAGVIIDRHHPQAGTSVSAKVLVMPGSRGSAGTPAGLAESIRARVCPAAILLPRADVNIAIGAMIAAALYDHHVPVLAVAQNDYVRLRTGQWATLGPTGKAEIDYVLR